MDYLSASTLEQHVLATLRVLGLVQATNLAERSNHVPQIEALNRNLRTLGVALEQRHGQNWTSLLQSAQHQLALDLSHQGSTTADLLYLQALATLLVLRHGPSDVRLAKPGLGLNLVTLAVATEHLLVLSSDPRPPEATDLTAFPLSPREEVLLEVARHLAVLEAGEVLPPGHRVTAADLQATAARVREVVEHPGQDQGPGAGLVLSRPVFLSGAWHRSLEEFRELPNRDELATLLLRSLITPPERTLLLKYDGALARRLDELATGLMPAEATDA